MQLSLSKHNFYQRLTSGIQLGLINYDLVCIDKNTGKLIIFEYLKRGGRN